MGRKRCEEHSFGFFLCTYLYLLAYTHFTLSSRRTSQTHNRIAAIKPDVPSCVTTPTIDNCHPGYLRTTSPSMALEATLENANLLELAEALLLNAEKVRSDWSFGRFSGKL